MGTAFQLLYLTKIFKMAAELCKGVLRPISGNMDVNTLASKRSGLIGNPKILRMRRVIHNNSSCVCLRLPFAAITQKRKNARVDLYAFIAKSPLQSRKSLATLMGVICSTSQCELRSTFPNLCVTNVIRIVTFYTLPPLESPTSSWMTRSQRSRRRDKGLWPALGTNVNMSRKLTLTNHALHFSFTIILL